MDSRINHKNIVTKKNRLSNLFYVRQAVASATFFITDPISEEPVSQDPIGIWLSDFYEILNFSKNRIVYADKRIKMNCDFC